MKIANKPFSALIWILFFQFIGFALGSITSANMEWYHTIIKSSLTPPNFVFPIVWSILYTLLALVGHFLWQNRQEQKANHILVFFIIQLVLNWLWTPIFFGWHLTGLALLDILTIIAITIYITIKTWANYPIIAYVMLTYLLWLLFASYLNFIIWIY